MKPVLVLAAALAALATPSFAHEGLVHDGCDPAATIAAGDLTISGAFTRATLPGARSGGGFVTIANVGTTDDRLVAATSEAAQRVELHEMRMEGDMMRMGEIAGGIVIPAGATVTLEPGGLHVMFLGIGQPFTEGECVALTLTFEKAGEVPVTLFIGGTSADGTHGEHGAAAGHGAGHAPANGANAHGHGARGGMALDQSGMTDVEAISALARSLFETPASPLSVDPIVVEGDYAIASWAQDGTGGRATASSRLQTSRQSVCRQIRQQRLRPRSPLPKQSSTPRSSRSSRCSTVP